MLNKQPAHWAITVPKATPKTPKLKCNTKTILRIAFNILIDTNWNIANFADPIPINTPKNTIFINVAGEAKDL